MPELSGAASTAARESTRPPRDNLVRACAVGIALRAAPQTDVEPSDNANGMPTLYGHFTRFNEWTEIDSFWEGNFKERIAPGSFKKTFREQMPKVLFQHGSDPQVGDKVLGAPDVLREDSEGPYYEVPLLDTTYNADLVPGLEAGLYGASFRFTVLREEWIEEPGASDHNPAGIPERTIKEVRCQEFGPVSFPAYPGATAGVRSMTDEFIVARATSDPERLRGLLHYLAAVDERTAAGAPRSIPDAPAPGEAQITDAGRAGDDSATDVATDVAQDSQDRAEESHPASEPDEEPNRVTVIHPIKFAAPRSALTPLHTKKGRL